MFANKPKESQALSWIIAAIWALSIFLAIPVARKLQAYFSGVFGKEFFLWLTITVLTLMLGKAVFTLKQIKPKFKAFNLIILLGTFTAFMFWAASLSANPERTLHFVQYGILSALVYRALTHKLNDFGIYVISILICALTGFSDEIIQWFTPNRFFDYYDIIIDTGAAVLVQFGIAFGVQPVFIKNYFSSYSLKISLNMLIVLICLFAFTLINTPKFANWYGEKYSWLANAKDNPSVMSDFGYSHKKDPKLSFISRYSEKKLPEHDSLHGVVAGEKIKNNYSAPFYPEFLRQHLVQDPLAYEVRVRLFRRDSYYLKAKEKGRSPEEIKESLNIALGEHLILKNYYPTTYLHSGGTWGEGTLSRIYSANPDIQYYHSPVGQDLLTALTQSQYLYLCLVLLVLSLGFRYYLSRPAKAI